MGFHVGASWQNGFQKSLPLCGADKLKSFWESHPSAEPMSRMAFRNRFLPFGSLPLRLLLGYLRCEGSLCHAVLTYEGITLHGTYSVTER